MEWGKERIIWLLLGHLMVSQMSRLFMEKRGWYDTENEYYLLLFTLTVHCLYYTSFSLEYCWHGSTQKRYYSFFWMLAYMFYYPVFHNGPIMTFNEFTKQYGLKYIACGKEGSTEHKLRYYLVTHQP
ncbi:Protein-cysteine N-palmitoyltransferase HHAT [Chelonia mydas]|uniref:Protein-cysteine N-palmitoyltransferase HHAT n=1 Tax=Chelonia mydas TaxID=8469 RepID=M7C9Z3_CHEMY|nr:Protein-cysteine N-palmitoyltransferase HHAT [Chelonia mydas]